MSLFFFYLKWSYRFSTPACFFTMKLLIIRFLLASQFAFLLLFRRLNFNMLNLPMKMISCGFFTEKNPSLSVRVRYWTKNIVWILLSTVNVTENITFTTVYSVPLFFSRNFSAFWPFSGHGQMELLYLMICFICARLPYIWIRYCIEWFLKCLPEILTEHRDFPACQSILLQPEKRRYWNVFWISRIMKKLRRLCILKKLL